jgi:hypothetical protein
MGTEFLRAVVCGKQVSQNSSQILSGSLRHQGPCHLYTKQSPGIWHAWQTALMLTTGPIPGLQVD